VSDLHLSHKAPLARSVELSWYATQAGYLHQLRIIAEMWNAPVVCAGDVFDDGWRTHRCPPELINFAINHLPPMYAIPGQHDLPYHRYELVQRSAYWTLCAAEVISPMTPGNVVVLPKAVHSQRTVVVSPFPWGFEIAPGREVDKTEFLNLCVAHKFVWTAGHGYPGAEDKDRVERQNLDGYDVALFGDNHKQFVRKVGDCRVFNHGTFMRRKSDERGYVPAVGLLHDDGVISQRFLCVDDDKWCDVSPEAEKVESSRQGLEFLSELADLSDAAVNFSEAVRRYVGGKDVGPKVRELILRLLSE
jgi:hypothetical protein